MDPIRRALAACVLVAGLGAAVTLGCDTLFPEFAGTPRDAGVNGASDDGGDATPHLGGTVCLVADLRDYRSCTPGAPGALRVTVEETRQQTMTDAAGRFTLPLSARLTTATVAVVDPRGNLATSVLPLRLTDGAADGVALPVVAAQTLSDLALQNGVALDPTRGAALAWPVDAAGAPVDNVAVNLPAAVRDGSSLLFLDVAPPTLSFTLTPPPGSGLRPDEFTLPIRAGALTLSTLPLPPG